MGVDRALPVCKRISGTEHPHTRTARANLATWTGSAGDPVAARDQYAVLLPVLERISGAEHPIPRPTAPTSPAGLRQRANRTNSWKAMAVP